MIILDTQGRNLKDSKGLDILDTKRPPDDKAVVVGMPKANQPLVPGVYRRRAG